MMGALPLASLATLTSDQAVDRAEKSLLPQGRDEVVMKIWGPIPAGTPIQSTREVVLVAPAEGYAVYIDLSPTANLFHPLRYAFVDASTGEVLSAGTENPPANEEQYTRISTTIGDRLRAATNRYATPSSVTPTLPPTRSARWAVLMSGGYNSSNNHVRYWNDLQNIYITLHDTYGFPHDNIITLCSDGLNPAPDQSNGQNSNPDFDNDGNNDIMYSCVQANVQLVFDSLSQLIVPGDQLFIFTTDHGSTNGGLYTSQNMWSQGEMPDTAFARILSVLPEGVTIAYTLEPCYSGGYMDNLIVPAMAPIVGAAACAYNENSWAMGPNYVYDTFVFHWTAAVKGSDAYGVPVNADYNSDGRITMDEAFRYAELNDFENETPQYGDQPVGLGTGVSLWPQGAGPFLTVSQDSLDDIGGNNNGMPDPGENISLWVWLTNVGNGTATNISGTLSTTDQFVTITQNSATFPNLAQLQQGQGSQPFLMTISAACPQGHTTITTLHLTADSGYTNNVNISFIVGDTRNQPTGPDQYGYSAYDNHDGPNCYPYNWVEIAPTAGGPGTAVSVLTGQDDRSTVLTMPFTFRYYGSNFTQITLCTNGWLAMGSVTNDSDWSESAIPNADGPPNMLAPFWEDMNLETGGEIATYHDAANHRFIVEYYHVPQYLPTNTLETFQVILFDPAFVVTPTGDGKVVFQYNTVSDPTSCTVGIENGTETTGLQYLFDGAYDTHAWPLQAGRSICFLAGGQTPTLDVTLTPVNPPIVIPAQGGSFSYNVSVANNGSSPITFDGWIMQYTPGGTWQGPMLGPVNLTVPGGVTVARLRNQNVPGSAAPGVYTYRGYVGVYSAIKWDSSSFQYTKSTTSDGGLAVGNWANDGQSFAPYENVPQTTAQIPASFGLDPCRPNPFNPSTAIRYQLSAVSHVSLRVYDTAGRLVTTLVEGIQEAGMHQVTFDGSRLSSGLYFVRMQAGGFNAVQKMMLIK
jgi:hypothetical protein